ncbi:MAG: hypothetical protein CSA26_07625 [Desulfobacterales bacterium]|nr:MAG: hypothetical protein CSA26_07625 [Desulfobacterales bacterium]
MSLLERIYFFHEELSKNRYPNARSLMREFEISLATARRDIAYLRDRLLAPLEYNNRKNGFYYSDDQFRLPFDNSPRIIFLLAMLNRLAKEAGLSSMTEIQQLERKLACMIAGEWNHIADKIQCEWIEVEHPAPAVFDVFIEAIIKKYQVKILYNSLRKRQTRRTVEPFRLINYQGRWYLYAWCLVRHETRMFHLARILEATLGERSTMTEEMFPADLDKSFGIFKGPPSCHAEIHFRDEAAELVKNQFWHQDQQIRKTEQGIILQLPVRDHREIMMKILQYGAQARVINPPELVAKIRAEVKALANQYRT